MFKKLLFKGQMSEYLVLGFLGALVAGGMYFMYSANLSTVQKDATTDPCYVTPSEQKTATYNHTTYNFLKPTTAVPIAERNDHLLSATPVTISTEPGVQQQGWIAKNEGGKPAASWDAGVFNLLFVDRTKTMPPDQIVPGYNYYEIYLKSGSPVPDFVQKYCSNQDAAVSPLQLTTSSEGNTIPPYSFNASDPNVSKWTQHDTETSPNPNCSNFRTGYPEGMYYLYAYDKKGSVTYDFPLQSNKGAGTVTLQINGTPKQYEAHFDFVAVICYVVLIDKDPGPQQGIEFRYVPKLPNLGFDPSTSHTTVPQAAQKGYQLQLKTFSFPQINPWGWWTPECKPAIYLYPEETTHVHVGVDPAGFLTYTNPLYPKGGWDVTAQPDGQITSNNKTYPYLYYEAKIHDDQVEIPDKGYVVAANELDNLYSTLLPKLSMSQKEIADFKAYWNGKLPKSPYYFVGVMPDPSIEKIEPLTIQPKPSTIIRVRLYFKALDKKISVPAPELKPLQDRKGFTVVEWGGMVKADKSHPFTCSQ